MHMLTAVNILKKDGLPLNHATVFVEHLHLPPFGFWSLLHSEPTGITLLSPQDVPHLVRQPSMF